MTKSCHQSHHFFPRPEKVKEEELLLLLLLLLLNYRLSFQNMWVSECQSKKKNVSGDVPCTSNSIRKLMISFWTVLSSMIGEKWIQPRVFTYINSTKKIQNALVHMYVDFSWRRYIVQRIQRQMHGCLSSFKSLSCAHIYPLLHVGILDEMVWNALMSFSFEVWETSISCFKNKTCMASSKYKNSW